MVKDMLPFCRPLRGFGLVGRPYCAGAPPLPVVCRLSEAFPFWLASSEAPNVQSGHHFGPRRLLKCNLVTILGLGDSENAIRSPVEAFGHSERAIRSPVGAFGDSERAIRSPVEAFGDSERAIWSPFGHSNTPEMLSDPLKVHSNTPETISYIISGYPKHSPSLFPSPAMSARAERMGIRTAVRPTHWG